MEPKRACATCRHHSAGVAVTLPSGRTWDWQECKKQWGPGTPIGVLKDVCPLWAGRSHGDRP